MTYASSKESLKNALNGIAAEVQANRDDEIEYATNLKEIRKGKRYDWLDGVVDQIRHGENGTSVDGLAGKML